MSNFELPEWASQRPGTDAWYMEQGKPLRGHEGPNQVLPHAVGRAFAVTRAIQLIIERLDLQEELGRQWLEHSGHEVLRLLNDVPEDKRESFVDGYNTAWSEMTGIAIPGILDPEWPEDSG